MWGKVLTVIFSVGDFWIEQFNGALTFTNTNESQAQAFTLERGGRVVGISSTLSEVSTVDLANSIRQLEVLPQGATFVYGTSITTVTGRIWKDTSAGGGGVANFAILVMMRR